MTPSSVLVVKPSSLGDIVHTLPAERLQDCVGQLAKSDLPPLWKPRADQFIHVDSLPYLGTGKLDLRRLKEIALGTIA